MWLVLLMAYGDVGKLGVCAFLLRLLGESSRSQCLAVVEI